MSGSGAFQRQLQQLFHLHDSGLDQASVDALPVFLYREIKGPKEPFDCPRDPFRPRVSFENPVFEFDDDSREEEVSGHGTGGVFPVRLGKFRSTNVVVEGGGGGGETKEEGETSSSSLDARRCYSLGSFQYVVADSNLQVALCPGNRDCGAGGIVRGRGGGGQNGNLAVDGDTEGKRIINMGSKGESFSVSKIWQWSKKGKLPSSCDTHVVTPPVNVSWAWSDASQAT
ncbi:hypothetical protein C3L33_14020, partial [Rhododendron williamsianum]